MKVAGQSMNKLIFLKKYPKLNVIEKKCKRHFPNFMEQIQKKGRNAKLLRNLPVLAATIASKSVHRTTTLFDCIFFRHL